MTRPVAATLLAGLLAGCPNASPPSTADTTPAAPTQTPTPTPEDPPTNDEPIPKRPIDVDPSARADAAGGVNAFTVALYGAAREPGNFNLSPFSAAMALALVDLGAKGKTRQAMDAALGLGGDGEAPHAALGALLQSTEGGGEPIEQYGEKVPPHELTVANSLWVAKGYALLPAYLEGARRLYGAAVEAIDVHDPTGSAGRINGWVSDKTREKIKDLVPPAAITDLTRLVVVNAVYLKARWHDPFYEDNTAPLPFHTEGGGTVQAPTMRQTHHFAYAEDEKVQVLELPYWGARDAELAMVFVLPKAKDGLGAVESGLTAAGLAAWIEAAQHGMTMVEVSIPKFRIETTKDLRESLEKVGLGELFGAAADLSGISEEKGLHVSKVLQKTYVDVDEKGTEAAAATAIMLAGAGMPQEPPRFAADHPFLYLIRDRRSGAILFMGRVADPTAG